MAATKTKAAKAGKTGTGKTGKIKVQYYRSSIGFSVQQKLTVKGLGFLKLNTVREHADTPSLRGMIAKIPHLVRVVD